MTKQGRLGYNSSNGRYGLLSSDLWIDTGFHCGEGLEVLVGDEWVQTRMEMNLAREWYLVGDILLWRSGICAGKDTGINRSMIRFGRCKADVHRTLCPRQGARGLLMDDTAVESAFTLLLTKVTKPPYPAKVS